MYGMGRIARPAECLRHALLLVHRPLLERRRLGALRRLPELSPLHRRRRLPAKSRRCAAKAAPDHHGGSVAASGVEPSQCETAVQRHYYKPFICSRTDLQVFRDICVAGMARRLPRSPSWAGSKLRCGARLMTSSSGRWCCSRSATYLWQVSKAKHPSQSTAAARPCSSRPVLSAPRLSL